MPLLTSPLIFAGFRFERYTIFLSSSSSGLYHFLIPATICFISVPVSNFKRYNLSALGWTFTSMIFTTFGLRGNKLLAPVLCELTSLNTLYLPPLNLTTNSHASVTAASISASEILLLPKHISTIFLLACVVFVARHCFENLPSTFLSS